jgi:hypothetical protein
MTVALYFILPVLAGTLLVLLLAVVLSPEETRTPDHWG